MEGRQVSSEELTTENEGEEEDSFGEEEGERRDEEETKYEQEEEKMENENKDEAISEREASWREYMKTYIENLEKLKGADKNGLRDPANNPQLPYIESEMEMPPGGYPFNLFNTTKPSLPNKLNPEGKVRLWRNMRANLPVDMGGFLGEPPPMLSKTDSGKWPGVWPCRKPEVERKTKKRMRRKKDGVLCEEDENNGQKLGTPRDDFANYKELWQARIPPTCPSPKRNPPMVDRSAGENNGLVDGDYIFCELASKKKGNRSYANVCLRGLKGMHLPELDKSRVRERTWKWCFYPSMVALLVKTQLSHQNYDRYKYTWSVNIDYVYDQGWMLFTHMGTMNVKDSQKLNDVTIYNYKYDIEVELVEEMKNVPRITNVSWEYFEKNQVVNEKRQRKDLMKTSEEIGLEKKRNQNKTPVHPATKKIEEWFDKLGAQYQNCIFRTTRYSLAFWKDGLFWYLYNPYRCEEFGFWDDTGYACIMKFCTRDALKRHLMILFLRAYVYAVPKPPSSNRRNKSDEEVNSGEGDAKNERNEEKPDTLIIQIFQIIYNKSELSNEKLLERGAPKPRMRPAKKREIEQCEFDPLDFSDPCSKKDVDAGTMEKPDWLKLFKVTWIRCPTAKKKIVQDNVVTGKLRWHQFYVEEPNKLFSLWGEIHPSEQIFPKENRGKQTYACYIVCAAMTRIMAPEYWTPKTLDAIVMCGDKHYTLSKLESALKESGPGASEAEDWDRRLMKSFKIGETMFEGNILSGTMGKLFSKSAKCLWRALQEMFSQHPFGVLTCESSCVGVFKFCGAYYMCDVHSFGPPLFQYGHGVIYLIRTTSFRKFVTVLILTIGTPECCDFELNAIEISKVIDLGIPTPRRRPEKKNKYRMLKKLTRVINACEEETRANSRKSRPKVERVEIDRIFCKGGNGSSHQGPSSQKSDCH